MSLLERVRHRWLRALLPIPIPARHAEYSVVASADDELGRPSPRLLEVAIDSVRRARDIDLSAVSDRITTGPRYPDLWPGEHYRLLAGLIDVLAPRVVIEIGTDTGLSSLAMLQTLPADGQIATFDVVPWDQLQRRHLSHRDFSGGRLT